MAICCNCFREKAEEGACPHCGYDPAESEKKYPLALKPGSILNGRYITGRVLGQGGFGITYIAQDDKTKDRVAIKEYLPSEFVGRESGSNRVQVYSDDRREFFVFGRQKFLEEAKTLAEFIGDEHIVRIYSYFEENGTAYFTMEYVEGEPLDKYMKGHGGRLSVEEANKLLLPLMEALAKVHAKGIVHRDIAPDNIIVQPNGQAKLIDFGAARYSTGEKSKSLDVVIKHGFAPGEQYMRRGRQGPFTDVYAMGATYYYAVTGTVPPDAVERSVDGKDLILPRTLGAKLIDSEQDVLLKALNVTAAERYQTMGEFREALEEASGQEKKTVPVREEEKKAPTPSRGEEKKAAAPASGEKKRPALRWLPAAAILLAVCVAAAVILPRALRSEKPEAEAQAPSEIPSEAYEQTPAPIVTVETTAEPSAAPEEIPAPASPEPEVLTECEVGDFILFGTYEQDNDVSNGPEDIEWLVLAKEGDRVFVVSRYALDARLYDEEYADTTWEKCDLRSWMNESFLQEAFSGEEQAMIPTVTVSADKNPEHSTKPGNETQDRVFLLSAADTERYFRSDNDRICEPTPYAKAQGGSVSDAGGCWWWLRSPGNVQRSASGIRGDGSYDDLGYYVNYTNNGIRPAMWIESPGGYRVSKTPEQETPVDYFDREIITFGSYEQDNDASNGAEDIEWLVLARENDRVLVISRYVLDCRQYHNGNSSVTWDVCSMREWLNGEFLNAAFSEEEQARIPVVKVSADKNPKHRTDPGKATEDRIFLLSITEAEQYFSSDPARNGRPTAYARAQGCYVENDSCWWWLRSPGHGRFYASFVKIGGSLEYDNGEHVFRGGGGVRPVMWIDLQA